MRGFFSRLVGSLPLVAALLIGATIGSFGAAVYDQTILNDGTDLYFWGADSSHNLGVYVESGGTTTGPFMMFSPSAGLTSATGAGAASKYVCIDASGNVLVSSSAC